MGKVDRGYGMLTEANVIFDLLNSARVCSVLQDGFSLLSCTTIGMTSLYAEAFLYTKVWL